MKIKQLGAILLLLLATGAFFATAAKLGTSEENRFVPEGSNDDGSSYNEKDNSDDDDEETQDPQMPLLKASPSPVAGVAISSPPAKSTQVNPIPAPSVATKLSFSVSAGVAIPKPEPGVSLAPIKPIAPSATAVKAASSLGISSALVGASEVPNALAKVLPSPSKAPLPVSAAASSPAISVLIASLKPSMAISNAAVPSASSAAPNTIAPIPSSRVIVPSSTVPVPVPVPFSRFIDHSKHTHPMAPHAKVLSLEEVAKNGNRVKMTTVHNLEKVSGEDKEETDDSTSGEFVNMEGSTEVPDVTKEENEHGDKETESRNKNVDDKKGESKSDNAENKIKDEKEVKSNENELLAPKKGKDPEDLIHNNSEKALDIFYQQQEKTKENDQKSSNKAEQTETKQVKVKDEKAKNDKGLVEKHQRMQLPQDKHEKKEPNALFGIEQQRQRQRQQKQQQQQQQQQQRQQQLQHSAVQKPQEALVMIKAEKDLKPKEDKSTPSEVSGSSVTRTEDNKATNKESQGKALPAVNISHSPAITQNGDSNTESVENEDIKAKAINQSAFKPNTVVEPKPQEKGVKVDEDSKAMTVKDIKTQQESSTKKDAHGNAIQLSAEQKPEEDSGAKNQGIGTFLEVNIGISSPQKEEMTSLDVQSMSPKSHRRGKHSRRHHHKRRKQEDYDDEIYNHDGEVAMEENVPKYEETETIKVDFTGGQENAPSEDEGEVVEDQAIEGESLEDKRRRRRRRRKGLRRRKGRRRGKGRRRRRRRQRHNKNRRHHRRGKHHKSRRHRGRRRKQDQVESNDAEVDLQTQLAVKEYSERQPAASKSDEELTEGQENGAGEVSKESESDEITDEYQEIEGQRLQDVWKKLRQQKELRRRKGRRRRRKGLNGRKGGRRRRKGLRKRKGRRRRKSLRKWKRRGRRHHKRRMHRRRGKQDQIDNSDTEVGLETQEALIGYSEYHPTKMSEEFTGVDRASELSKESEGNEVADEYQEIEGRSLQDMWKKLRRQKELRRRKGRRRRRKGLRGRKGGRRRKGLRGRKGRRRRRKGLRKRKGRRRRHHKGRMHRRRGKQDLVENSDTEVGLETQEPLTGHSEYQPTNMSEDFNEQDERASEPFNESEEEELVDDQQFEDLENRREKKNAL